MEDKTCKKGWGTIGEEGPLNRSPKYPTVGCRFAPGRYHRWFRRYYRPLEGQEDTTGRKQLPGSGSTSAAGGTTARVQLKGVLAVVVAVLPPGEKLQKTLIQKRA